MVKSLNIGVLALQGGFDSHVRLLKSLGVRGQLVRYARELENCDALIIPGGESTTMTRILENQQMWDPVHEFILSKPVFGTCAGSILLGQQIGDPRVRCFSRMNMTADRNAYGRLVDSFTTTIAAPALNEAQLPAVFIRAPKFKDIDPAIEVLAHYRDEPVILRQDKLLVTAFHPELSDNASVHSYFLTLIEESIHVG